MIFNFGKPNSKNGKEIQKNPEKIQKKIQKKSRKKSKKKSKKISGFFFIFLDGRSCRQFQLQFSVCDNFQLNPQRICKSYR